MISYLKSYADERRFTPKVMAGLTLYKNNFLRIAKLKRKDVRRSNLFPRSKDDEDDEGEKRRINPFDIHSVRLNPTHRHHQEEVKHVHPDDHNLGIE